MLKKFKVVQYVVMYIEFVNTVLVFCTYMYYISTFLILLTSASALRL